MNNNIDDNKSNQQFESNEIILSYVQGDSLVGDTHLYPNIDNLLDTNNNQTINPISENPPVNMTDDQMSGLPNNVTNEQLNTKLCDEIPNIPSNKKQTKQNNKFNNKMKNIMYVTFGLIIGAGAMVLYSIGKTKK